MLGHNFPKSLINHWLLKKFIDALPLTKKNNVHHVQEIHHDNTCLYLWILLLTYMVGWDDNVIKNTNVASRDRLVVIFHHFSYIND